MRSLSPVSMMTSFACEGFPVPRHQLPSCSAATAVCTPGWMTSSIPKIATWRATDLSPASTSSGWCGTMVRNDITRLRVLLCCRLPIMECSSELSTGAMLWLLSMSSSDPNLTSMAGLDS